MTIVALTSILIFAVTFFFILTERIHRTVIALAGAVAMVVAGIFLDFYHTEDAIAAVDYNTIGLLFGMMVVVVALEKTGFFQYLGIWTAKKTKGNPWLLMVGLGALTSVLSMILDNVTTIILITPVTIIICRMLGLNPLPILLTQAMLSNVGGTGTLIGDPPNIMIGSAAGYAFTTFLVYSLPVAIVTWFATVALFKFFFKKDLSAEPKNIDRLMAMNEKEAIHDPQGLKRILLILGLVIVLFFLHNLLHLEASVVALIGAALILIAIYPTKDPQPIFEKTELSVLIFFASLFVIVGGLEHAGVLESISRLILEGAEKNILITALVILWASAFFSALVDNIPLTVAMIPIILGLESQGIPVDLLWWALVFGVGFGGNASPIGSTAGVIVVAKSEQTEQPISFMRWLKVGVPVTVVGLSIASVAIIAYHFLGFFQ